MSFKEIKFPKDFDYSTDSDSVPFEFYINIFPRSTLIYLKLGYFSSAAIQVLAFSFARFIYGGGIIKIVTNHYLYNTDSELLDVNSDVSSSRYLNNLEWLHEELSGPQQHFIDCLKYLIEQGRLEIIPVIMKPGKMVHYKQGVFEDKEGNMVAMEGSCNFTANGLLENGESISVFRSWGSDYEVNKIESRFKDVKNIINKKNDKYEYLDRSSIIDAVVNLGHERSIEELLKDETELILECDNDPVVRRLMEESRDELIQELDDIRVKPRFPFDSEPREYQKEACEAWHKAGKKGLFAMATGTGKTITSLNCLLNEYEQSGYYQALILVPTAALLAQWIDEVRSFNFKEIIPASSKYPGWKSEIRELTLSLTYNNNISYVVISTYATFVSDIFQKLTASLPESSLLIADEAHNIGSGRAKKLLPSIKYVNRIGLSATPKRIYDEEGNAAIESFFNSTEPYTYSFSMERAIRDGYLCRYIYYPNIVPLTEDEMVDYEKITSKLVKFYNGDSFVKSDVVEMLLLERKRIIHRAHNKLFEFERILGEIKMKKGSLKYTFVYVPEGSNSEGDNLLDMYLKSFSDNFPYLRAFPYISGFENKDIALQEFENGDADVLFSMKCLDEGVDIPRAECAIFCSSTGNPRQFIQRRGRVLRKHKDKNRAIIYDLIVVPQSIYEGSSSVMEKNMLKNELVRVIYFASLADNYYESMGVCQPIAEQYGLDVFALQDELRVNKL